MWRSDLAATCRRIVEQSLELYTCSASSSDSEMPVYARNGTIPRAYNELATLMSVTGVAPAVAGHAGACGAIWAASSAALSARMILARPIVPCWSHLVCTTFVLCAGEDSIKHLLSRGTHREFGYAALVVMLVFYFAGAVWAAGSAIASGLFVPMLLIGSCIGRIAGLMAVDFAAAGGHGSAGCAVCPDEAQPLHKAPAEAQTPPSYLCPHPLSGYSPCGCVNEVGKAVAAAVAAPSQGASAHHSSATSHR